RLTDQHDIHLSLEQLAKSSESATRLVNQLLSLARAENQTQANVSLSEINLSDLARSVVKDWVPTSFARKIDLGFEEDELPLTILGNPLMLRELLNNLIDNALHYTPEQGHVTVRVRATDKNNQRDMPRVILEVEDTGFGISPTEREHVFERFYRVLDNDAKRSGSGLGLAIVREIAQQHNADVAIFYNPKSTDPILPGSLFRVAFPYATEIHPDFTV
ncbi:MAG: HAMP domain-containing histidine kinase, partial [Glaciimonas sp.]|nr:HAMP domain-containing histidine kinase [Glaciimonas sp.]